MGEGVSGPPHWIANVVTNEGPHTWCAAGSVFKSPLKWEVKVTR